MSKSDLPFNKTNYKIMILGIICIGAGFVIMSLDKEEYGFEPNLSNITTGEYIDLETYCKEPIENLHIIMSILYRKITFKRNERYAIENYNPDEFKEELFKDCPMDIALNSLGFFLTLGSVLAMTSVRYLKAQETKQQKA